MPNNQTRAQRKPQNRDIPQTNYIELQQSPYLLYNTKDINTEYPNRESFLKNLMDGLKPQEEIKEKINTIPQVVPLSLAKSGVQKYFPERTTCFKKIISTIQQNPELAQQLNTIINQTIMKPTKVHKETNPRPSSERDKVCAVLIFLEGIIHQNNFANYVDQRDNLALLSSEPKNRPVSDTLHYETRLAISDKRIMPGEMMQKVLDADNIFQNWIKQQESGKEIAVR